VVARLDDREVLSQLPVLSNTYLHNLLYLFFYYMFYVIDFWTKYYKTETISDLVLATPVRRRLRHRHTSSILSLILDFNFFSHASSFHVEILPFKGSTLCRKLLLDFNLECRGWWLNNM